MVKSINLTFKFAFNRPKRGPSEPPVFLAFFAAAAGAAAGAGAAAAVSAASTKPDITDTINSIRGNKI